MRTANLPAPLDPATIRVRSIILNAAAYAYAYRPIDDEALVGPSCLSCGGDGCGECGRTGVRA